MTQCYLCGNIQNVGMYSDVPVCARCVEVHDIAPRMVEHTTTDEEESQWVPMPDEPGVSTWRYLAGLR